MSDNSKILANAYNGAGKEFLAYRLTRVMAKIKNRNDIALHNDVVKEIDVMVGAENAGPLMLDIAERILMYANKRKDS